MSDNTNKFHNFALKSIVFKGRTDWYFCFLKAEKIAQVMTKVIEGISSPSLTTLVEKVTEIPESIIYFAAGELDPAMLLADLFSLISTLRMLGANGTLPKGNSEVLISEYEHIAERMGNGMQFLSTLSAEDFTVPVPLALEEKPRALEQLQEGNRGHFKRTSKGQDSPLRRFSTKEQENRMSEILTLVRNADRGLSIRDISKVIRNCSEKTIQRELASLIQQGSVQKVGERRWSVYLPTSK